MSLRLLRDQIESKTARLAVIGLGYVGLPVACAFAEIGFDVLGVDIQQARIDKINQGISPIEGDEPGLADLLERVVSQGRLRATSDYAQLADRTVIFINVETPVDENHAPRYEALRAVLRGLGPVLAEGALVIVESTIAPRTMEDVVVPLLQESSGRTVNGGFYLGNCPERVMPGKLLANLYNMSRVVGGMTPETAETMTALYQTVVRGELDCTDCITAELVKATENTYRDVQIAFANEVALICGVVGGDVWRVRELVNKSPGRNMLLAGAGVGGHCIPKDPWLLAFSTAGKIPLKLIPAARAVNDNMPFYVANLVAEALQSIGRPVSEAKVAVLGYAYLEDSDDTRNSPSEMLVERLCEWKARIVIHDPWVKEYQGDLMERIAGCDALVVMVGHQAYRMVDLCTLKALLRTPILVDGRHIFDRTHAQALGYIYRGIGQG